MNGSLRDKPSDFYRDGKPGFPRVSVLMLERYNLGEVTGEEKALVEAALAGDAGLAERLGELRRSDADIRRGPAGLTAAGAKPRRRNRAEGPRLFLVWGLGAAALALFTALPLFRAGQFSGLSGERIKGSADAVELRAYLKTEGEQAVPADQAVLREGNTVQLAYTVNGEGRYGVIFSIDGRSAVTLHYPYAPGADTRLVTGKRTLLEESYTLDDAPDYEMFFFVIGDEPLDTPEILDSARYLARNPQTALEQSRSVFEPYELKTLTLRKE
jgi:hypothetical protein